MRTGRDSRLSGEQEIGQEVRPRGYKAPPLLRPSPRLSMESVIPALESSWEDFMSSYVVRREAAACDTEHTLVPIRWRGLGA